tara:strand:+ start:461 stop:676 length:216 start_codon:yes stop_codon:yes gene_type:complete
MEQQLDRVENITNALKNNQEEITQLGRERRKLWFEIWNDGGISQQKIADYCGITRQVVFLEIKRYRAESNL